MVQVELLVAKSSQVSLNLKKLRQLKQVHKQQSNFWVCPDIFAHVNEIYHVCTLFCEDVL
jgi:hypothetical protein